MANPRKATISRRLTSLERKTIKTTRISQAQKKLLKKTAILLIGTLGWGAMAKEVEQGKHTAAETLKHLSTMKLGMTPQKRRIAALGAKAAAQADI